MLAMVRFIAHSFGGTMFTTLFRTTIIAGAMTFGLSACGIMHADMSKDTSSRNVMGHKVVTENTRGPNVGSEYDCTYGKGKRGWC